MNITATFTPHENVDKWYRQFFQLYHAGQYDRALSLAQQILLYMPHHADMLSNAASAAHRAGEWALAIDYAQQSLQICQNHLNSLDILSYVYYREGDLAQSSVYGKRALQQRDEMMMAKHQSMPMLPELPVRVNGKKIISFSLFGDSPKYLTGALVNAEIAPTLYPDWQCRFYVDGSVPEWVKQKLRDLGAEVIEVTGEVAQWVGTVWRFLAADDECVARVIFRDVDSILSWREVAAVREWEQSGQRFHTIRDGGSHTEVILAGLWGAVGRALPNMQVALREYFRQPVRYPRFADQLFLREYVWIYVRQDVFAQDRLFGFMNAHKLPELSDSAHHIGSGQIMTHTMDMPFPDGTPIRWTVNSRISPIRAADFSLKRLPERREVFAFETQVRDGKITLHVPRLYWEGVATEDSVVQIDTLIPIHPMQKEPS